MNKSSVDQAFIVALATPKGRVAALREAISDAISNGDDCAQFRQRVETGLAANEAAPRQQSRSDY